MKQRQSDLNEAITEMRGNDDPAQEASDQLYEVGFRLEYFLSNEFGFKSGHSYKNRFSLDDLLKLDPHKREKFEELVEQVITGHFVWSHFSEGEKK